VKHGEKVHAPPVTVSHTSLRRFSTESPYRSYCPVCNTGVLLVNRDQKSYRLINADRCTYCAQLIIYSDETIAGEKVKDVSKRVPVRGVPAEDKRPTAWDRVLDEDEDKPKSS
jgi:hypothetical protein